jgi:predicted DNA-binding protein
VIKRLCVSMPKATYEWLDTESRRAHRTKSNFIGHALEELRRNLEAGELIARADTAARKRTP